MTQPYDIKHLRSLFPLIEETRAFQDGTAGEASWKTRQQEWQQYLADSELQPAEFLLPRIACHCPNDEPPFIVQGAENPHYSVSEVEIALGKLAPWGFYFRLRDGLTTELPSEIKSDRDTPKLTRNRTLCRSHMITNTVEKLLGDEIAQTTVLDMGSNCGFFSFDIASRGVRSVTGVELREDNLARAQYLKNYYQINNVNFIQADILSYKPTQTFDVVYNLGVLYHVVDPIGLLQHSYNLCKQFAVVDTVCRKEPVSAFFAVYDKKTHRLGAGSQTVEFHPTYRALIDAMHFVGFKNIIELVPTSGKVSGIYATQTRRCLIGFK